MSCLQRYRPGSKREINEARPALPPTVYPVYTFQDGLSAFSRIAAPAGAPGRYIAARGSPVNDSEQRGSKMIIRFLSAIFIVFAIVLQSGCTSLSDAEDKRGSGKVQVYELPRETVWNSLLEVLGTTSLDMISENESEGVILARRKLTWFSYGENVAIYVEAINDNASTRVEVVNVKRVESNTNALDWDTRIFIKLDRALK